eukprot:7099088-Pyramimonas_sp.AAC.1
MRGANCSPLRVLRVPRTHLGLPAVKAQLPPGVQEHWGICKRPPAHARLWAATKRAPLSKR